MKKDRYHILVDASGVVLACSGSLTVINYLRECASDSSIVFSANTPNYQGWFSHRFFQHSVASNERCWQWSWNRKQRRLEPTPEQKRTAQVVKMSRLMGHKENLISRIMTQLDNIPRRALAGLQFQSIIYFAKKLQAQAFRDSGYDEQKALASPYVLQYANHAGISPRQAADDILLKAKFTDDILMKTEMLRLKYFGKVRKAATVGELDAIHQEFVRDFFVNAQV